MKAYLLVFDPLQINKDIVKDAIDKLDSVVNWTLFFGNSMCLVSHQDAKVLSREIHASLPGVRFLVSNIDPTRKAGWLPKSLWEFMNEPAPAAESSDA